MFSINAGDSEAEQKTVQILIRQFCQKLAYLDIHCVLKRRYLESTEQGLKINVSNCFIPWLFLSENTLSYAVLSNFYCLLIYLSANLTTFSQAKKSLW